MPDAKVEIEYPFRDHQQLDHMIVHRGVLMRDRAGRPIKLTGAMTDVTERLRALRQIEEVKRVVGLGQVATSMAHEFNNVLMGIQPFAELIPRQAPGNVAIKDAVTRIQHTIARGKRITGDILRYTRETKPEPVEVSAKRWLEHLEREARKVMGDAIEMRFIPPPSHIQMSADSEQLTHVAIALLLNARDAARPGGQVDVFTTEDRSFEPPSIKDPASYVHFCVRDDGAGIAETDLNQIFNPLFTTKRGSTGLGLTVAMQIVNAHGGQLFVESELGKGSKFHMFIPRTLDRAIDLL